MKKIIIAMLILFQTGLVLAQEEKPKIWSLEDCISYAVKNNITVKQAIYCLQNNRLGITMTFCIHYFKNLKKVKVKLNFRCD